MLTWAPQIRDSGRIVSVSTACKDMRPAQRRRLAVSAGVSSGVIALDYPYRLQGAGPPDAGAPLGPSSQAQEKSSRLTAKAPEAPSRATNTWSGWRSRCATFARCTSASAWRSARDASAPPQGAPRMTCSLVQRSAEARLRREWCSTGQAQQTAMCRQLAMRLPHARAWPCRCAGARRWELLGGLTARYQRAAVAGHTVKTQYVSRLKTVSSLLALPGLPRSGSGPRVAQPQ